MERNKIEQIKELTLMLMYLTSWEESFIPGLRRKPDHTGMRPLNRYCWKGYDFDILNELTKDGLINDEGHKSPAIFTEEGIAKAIKFLQQYGIET